MFCAGCGKEIPEGANFCPNCGLKVEAVDESPKETDGGATEEVETQEEQSQEKAIQAQGIVCPNCGSSDLTIERFTWWGGILGASLANRLRCKTCGHKFRIDK